MRSFISIYEIFFVLFLWIWSPHMVSWAFSELAHASVFTSFSLQILVESLCFFFSICAFFSLSSFSFIFILYVEAFLWSFIACNNTATIPTPIMALQFKILHRIMLQSTMFILVMDLVLLRLHCHWMGAIIFLGLVPYVVLWMLRTSINSLMEVFQFLYLLIQIVKLGNDETVWFILGLQNRWFLKLLCPSFLIKNVIDVWIELKEWFLKSGRIRVAKLRYGMNNLKQGSLSVTNFFTELKILWDELEIYRPLP